MLILNSNDRLESDLLLTDILASRSVDGIFMVPGMQSLASEDLKQQIEKIQIPFILVDRSIEDLEVSKIYFDHTRGAYDAVSHLIEAGHTRIAIIASEHESSTTNSRLEGYKKALRKHRIEIDPEYIFYGNYKFSGGYQAAREILKTDVTAVFSANDMMTLGFMKYLMEQDKEVPEEVSLVIYDNILDHFSLNIPISSVLQDTEKLAKECFALFLRTRKTNSIETKVLKTKFVATESIAAPRST